MASAKLISRTACYVSHNISKRTVIGSFPIGSRTRLWLSSLDEDQWTITSFVPETRLVCADVVSTSGVRTHLALTLPEVHGS
jgi:hypothetical protein